MTNLQIEVEQQNLTDKAVVLIVKIGGILDANTFRQFETHMEQFFANGYHHLVLVLTGVTYINSSGMGLLVKLADKIEQAGKHMKLVNIPDRLKTIFNMLGFVNYFAIHQTQEEAIASLKEGIPEIMSGEMAIYDSDVKNAKTTESQVPLSGKDAPKKNSAVDSTPGDFGENDDEIAIEEPSGLSGISEQDLPEIEIVLDEMRSRKDSGKQAKQTTPTPKAQHNTPALIQSPAAPSHKQEISPPPPPEGKKTTRTQKDTLVVDHQVVKNNLSLKDMYRSDSPQRPQAELDRPREGATTKSERRASFSRISDKAKEVKRNICVRYFKRMSPFQCFPLVVIFSSQKLAFPAHKKIAQVDGEPLCVEESNSIVEIVPIVPGCMVTPDHREVDISPQRIQVDFNITPLAEGTFDQACVEIYYRKKLSQTIMISNQIAKQTIAKVALALSAVSPVLSLVLDSFSGEIRQSLPNVVIYMGKLAQKSGGTFSLGLILAFLCLLCAGVFYWLKRPQAASPIETMLAIKEEPEPLVKH